MNERKVHFCFPGNNFKDEFVLSLIHMLVHRPPFGIKGCGIKMSFSFNYSSDIYMCRNDLIRMHPETFKKSRDAVLAGFDYDYVFWIDSDQKWAGWQVLQLIEHDVDVVSGIIPIGPHQQTCAGTYRIDNGSSYFSYYTIPGLLEEEQNEKGLIEVDFTGFGFLCVKRGVFEKLGYPYFKTNFLDVDDYRINGTPVAENIMVRMATSEDIGWCSRAKKEAGVQIFVDPEVRIGHKKEILLRAEGYAKAN